MRRSSSVSHEAETHTSTKPTALRELELDGDHTYYINSMLVHNWEGNNNYEIKF
jgi:hypothetical protein